MPQETAKREYKLLQEAGELLDLFPDFTGQWSKDKKEFIRYQEMNEEVLNNLDIDFELEEGLDDIYEEPE